MSSSPASTPLRRDGTPEELARASELVGLIDYWWDVHQKWQKSPAPTPGEDWLEAVHAIPEGFKSGMIPGVLRVVAQLVLSNLTEALLRWDADAKPYPSELVLRALYAIRDAAKSAAVDAESRQLAEPWPVESAYDLVEKQRVPIGQVAKMLFGEHNRENVAKVMAEIDNPGLYTKARGYKPPQQLRHEEEIASLQLQANRNLAAVQKRIAVQKHEEVAPSAASPIAPESVEELLRQRVAPYQIAKMKKITVAEVEATALRILKGENGSRPAQPIDPTQPVPVRQPFETPADRVARLKRELAEALASAPEPTDTHPHRELTAEERAAEEDAAEEAAAETRQALADGDALASAPLFGGILNSEVHEAVEQPEAPPLSPAPSAPAPRSRNGEEVIPGARLGQNGIKTAPGMPTGTSGRRMSKEQLEQEAAAAEISGPEEVRETDDRAVVLSLLNQGRSVEDIKAETGIHGNTINAVKRLFEAGAGRAAQ